MPTTTTTKLGLVKPDDSEFGDVAVINANNDKIDASIGVKWVNDGVVPSGSELFDGLIVREITSRKAFVSRAGSLVPLTTLYGVWNYASTAVPSGTNTILLTPTASGTAGNTLSSTDVVISGNTLIISTPGVYTYTIEAALATAVGSWRRYVESVITPSGALWELRGVGSTDDEALVARGNVVVQSGQSQTISARAYQASGGSINVVGSIQLIRLP